MPPDVNGPMSRTTRVSRYQKGEKQNLDFTEARDSEWQLHQLGHVQVCTSLQTDNHTRTPPLSYFTFWIPFLPANQQLQSTEGSSLTNWLIGVFIIGCGLCFPADIFVKVVRCNEPLWDDLHRRSRHFPSSDGRRLRLFECEAQSRRHWMKHRRWLLIVHWTSVKSHSSRQVSALSLRSKLPRYKEDIGFQSFNIWLHSFTACDVYLEPRLHCQCLLLSICLSSRVISSFCTLFRG